MSENAVQEKPEEAHFTLDLAACARVLTKQQRKREEAALAKREAEERAVRAAVQRVLLNLSVVLEVERDVVEVQVEDSDSGLI